MIVDSPYAETCAYLGRTVSSTTGPPLGRIEDLLADAHSHAPQWAVIRLVGIRARYRALPLLLVLETERGLVAPVTRAMLRTTPTVALGVGLTAAQELALHGSWGNPL